MNPLENSLCFSFNQSLCSKIFSNQWITAFLWHKRLTKGWGQSIQDIHCSQCHFMLDELANRRWKNMDEQIGKRNDPKQWKVLNKSIAASKRKVKLNRLNTLDSCNADYGYLVISHFHWEYPRLVMYQEQSLSVRKEILLFGLW